MSATPAAVYGPCAASRIPWDSSMSASTSRLPPIACSRPCACGAAPHQVLIDPFDALRWAQCTRIGGAVSPRDTHAVFEVATLECDIPFAHACHQSVGSAGRMEFLLSAGHCTAIAGATGNRPPTSAWEVKATAATLPCSSSRRSTRHSSGPVPTWGAIHSNRPLRAVGRIKDDECKCSAHLQRQAPSQAGIVNGNRHYGRDRYDECTSVTYAGTRTAVAPAASSDSMNLLTRTKNMSAGTEPHVASYKPDFATQTGMQGRV